MVDYTTAKQKKEIASAVANIKINHDHRRLAANLYKKWNIALNGKEKVYYNRIAPVLIARGVLNDGSYILLINLCAKLYRRDLCNEYLKTTTIVQDGKINPAAAQLNTIETGISQLCREFVLTPSDVNRAGAVAEQINEANKQAPDKVKRPRIQVIKDEAQHNQTIQ